MNDEQIADIVQAQTEAILAQNEINNTLRISTDQLTMEIQFLLIRLQQLGDRP
jgi:hypothetical protein